MTKLRAENHALQSELSSQQQQLAEASRRPQGPTSRPGGGFISNKKNEDDTFDVEAAVLTGAPCCAFLLKERSAAGRWYRHLEAAPAREPAVLRLHGRHSERALQLRFGGGLFCVPAK